MSSLADDINFYDVLNRMLSENMPEILRKLNQKLSEVGAESVAYLSEGKDVRVDNRHGYFAIDLEGIGDGNQRTPIWGVIEWQPTDEENIGGTHVFRSVIIDEVIERVVELVISEKNPREL
jgi:hypothetical protein